MFTNVMANAYQSQLNAGFSKVCEIFKVRSIESLKYIREFHTPVCYCGDISTPWNVTLNKTSCDWLFDMSVKLMGGPWPMNAAIYSRPSAVSLRVWLCETSTYVINWLTSTILCVKKSTKLVLCNKTLYVACLFFVISMSRNSSTLLYSL